MFHFPIPVAVALLLVPWLGIGYVYHHNGEPIDGTSLRGVIPWFVVVGITYALQEIGYIPPPVSAITATPVTYLSVLLVPATIWIVLTQIEGVSHSAGVEISGWSIVGIGGIILIFIGVKRSSAVLQWVSFAVVVAVGLSFCALIVLKLAGSSRIDDPISMSMLFSQLLDATTTAVGVAVFNVGERNPVSRLFINMAHSTTVTDIFGVGWLFVLVKFFVASFLLYLISDIENERTRIAFLLGAIAPGLAPAAHNITLFILST